MKDFLENLKRIRNSNFASEYNKVHAYDGLVGVYTTEFDRYSELESELNQTHKLLKQAQELLSEMDDLIEKAEDESREDIR